MVEYDIVVVGAGHSGLTAAAYFAVLGFRTVVLEKNNVAGGGVVSRETMPGVWQDLHSVVHAAVLANPMIRDDELGLRSKYGLEYLHSDMILGAPFLDGSHLILYKDLEQTVKSIEKLSPHDARQYRKLHDWAQPLVKPFLDFMFEPPPPFGSLMTDLESTPERSGCATAHVLRPRYSSQRMV